jgi:CDP-diacylglycerol--glycerol-3-phosphate 3-phosphatidyltransferase
MSLPMILTAGRMVLAPVFFILYVTTGFGSPLVYLLWLILIISEISDLLDGYFARKMGLVSEIGKVLDPFADAISRITYFVCFAWSGYLPIWVLLILVYRDLITSYIRVIASNRGVMLAARWSGKLKAWIYGLSGVAGLAVFSLHSTGWFEQALPAVEKIAQISFFVSAAIAVVSVLDYGVFLRGFFRGSVDK